jgi:hypothetical protein
VIENGAREIDHTPASFAERLTGLQQAVTSGALRFERIASATTSVDESHAVQMSRSDADDPCRQFSNWAQ